MNICDEHYFEVLVPEMENRERKNSFVDLMSEANILPEVITIKTPSLEHIPEDIYELLRFPNPSFIDESKPSYELPNLDESLSMPLLAKENKKIQYREKVSKTSRKRRGDKYVTDKILSFKRKKETKRKAKTNTGRLAQSLMDKYITINKNFN